MTGKNAFARQFRIQGTSIMHTGRIALLLILFALKPPAAQGQERRAFLSSLAATRYTPLLTAYAAAADRNDLSDDIAYRLMWRDSEHGIEFASSRAGSLGASFQKEGAFRRNIKDMHAEPVITLSYPDMVQYSYYPFQDIRADATHIVTGTSSSLYELVLKNEGRRQAEFDLILHITSPGGQFTGIRASPDSAFLLFEHMDPADACRHEAGSAGQAIRNATAFLYPPDSIRFFSEPDRPFSTQIQATAARATVLAAFFHIEVAAGSKASVRAARCSDRSESGDNLLKAAGSLLQEPVSTFATSNEIRCAGLLSTMFDTPDHELLFWSGMNLVRQCQLQPERRGGRSNYVSTREPRPECGRDGQNLDDAIALTAVALCEPEAAMDALRVFRDEQRKDGFVPAAIRYPGRNASAAPQESEPALPIYAWLCERLHSATWVRSFLEEMYESSRAFHEYFTAARDRDKDGLCEWQRGDRFLTGPMPWEAQPESDAVEALDLNCLLVMDAKALAKMAERLGRSAEAADWLRRADKRSALINAHLWDEETGFYYDADRQDNDFTLRKRHDLKRRGIAGFLPLTAGIASDKQALLLLTHLLDTSRFWRRNGIPSMAADDPAFDGNSEARGAVAVHLNYLVALGLRDAGFIREAQALTRRLARAMIENLQSEHMLPECHGADSSTGGIRRFGIRAGVISKMIWDMKNTARKTP